MLCVRLGQVNELTAHTNSLTIVNDLICAQCVVVLLARVICGVAAWANVRRNRGTPWEIVRRIHQADIGRLLGFGRNCSCDDQVNGVGLGPLRFAGRL